MTSEQAAIRQATLANRQATLANRQAEYARRERWNRRLNVAAVACVFGIAVYVLITEAVRRGWI